MSQLTTNPSSVEFGAQEQWAPGIDCTAALSNYPNSTPTQATVVFTDTASGATVSLPDAPSVSGNVVSQRIAKDHVTAGHTYQLTLTFVPSTSTDVLETVLQVYVPGFS